MNMKSYISQEKNTNAYALSRNPFAKTNIHVITREQKHKEADST